MPSKGIKAVSVNPKHEAFKQVELRATRHAHGQGFSGVMLRDLLRYYLAIERERLNLRATLSNQDFKMLEQVLIQNKREYLSPQHLYSFVDDYLRRSGQFDKYEHLLNMLTRDESVTALAIIDAFEFMEAKEFKSLKDAMIALDNGGY